MDKEDFWLFVFKYIVLLLLAVVAIMGSLLMMQATFNQVINHTELETEYNPNGG